MARRWMMLLCAMLPLALATGCGKKAPLDAPAGEEDRFPRPYPKGAPEPDG